MSGSLTDEFTVALLNRPRYRIGRIQVACGSLFIQ